MNPDSGGNGEVIALQIKNPYGTSQCKGQGAKNQQHLIEAPKGQAQRISDASLGGVAAKSSSAGFGAAKPEQPLTVIVPPNQNRGAPIRDIFRWN